MSSPMSTRSSSSRTRTISKVTEKSSLKATGGKRAIKSKYYTPAKYKRSSQSTSVLKNKSTSSTKNKNAKKKDLSRNLYVIEEKKKFKKKYSKK